MHLDLDSGLKERAELEAEGLSRAEKSWRGDDDFTAQFSSARYSISDLTPLQTSVLSQDINFHVAVIFNSSTDGAQMEGVGEQEAWRKAEEGFCEPEWQWMRENVACK